MRWRSPHTRQQPALRPANSRCSLSDDNNVNIDFGALRDKASAIMDAGEKARASDAPVTEVPATPVAEVNTPEGVDPTVTRVKGASEADKVVEKPAEVPATPATASLTDDTIVKVTVDGEEVDMPWKEAKAGISRTSKFTKSMQQLASERKAFDAERQTLTALKSEREQIATFLNNPNAVAAYLQSIAPQQQQPPAQQVDPNAVITVAEAQALATQQSQAAMNAALREMQAIAAQKDEQIADAIAGLEHKQQTAKHAVVIDATLKDIFASNPVLNGIPNAEDLIRYNVAMMNPQTEAEALDAFKQVAGGMVENISKHYTNTKKVAAVAQAKEKLVTNTIEPAGGAAPQIQPTTFKTADGGINWNKVRDMASERYKPLA